MQYVVTIPSLFISLCMLRDLPQHAMGEIPSCYIPMFLWKDFLMGWIRKIQNHKEERDRSGKFKKTRRKEQRKEKKRKRHFYVRGGFHNHVFSISWECPGATTLVRPFLRRTR